VAQTIADFVAEAELADAHGTRDRALLAASDLAGWRAQAQGALVHQ